MHSLTGFKIRKWMQDECFIRCCFLVYSRQYIQQFCVKRAKLYNTVLMSIPRCTPVCGTNELDVENVLAIRDPQLVTLSLWFINVFKQALAHARLRKHAAATKIQALWRGAIARSRYRVTCALTFLNTFYAALLSWLCMATLSKPVFLAIISEPRMQCTGQGLLLA